jgi:hypothetical protein
LPPIIIMPPHIIIIGMPICIMFIMRLQHSMNIIWSMPAIGFISHIMPVGVMVQVISHIIIGIMPIWGIIPICGIMDCMPPIIGIMPICGIIMFIGIMPGMPIWGIMPICMFGIMFGIICAAVFIFVSNSQCADEAACLVGSGLRPRRAALNGGYAHADAFLHSRQQGVTAPTGAVRISEQASSITELGASMIWRIRAVLQHQLARVGANVERDFRRAAIQPHAGHKARG